MQDELRSLDVIIELIAKGLDEPLSPAEQAQVNQAMQNSIAIRLAAEGLYEFDGLLKRTGMAIPNEGLPARVLARIEAYERRRTRAEWLLTLGILFLGLVSAAAWVVLDFSEIVRGAAGAVSFLVLIVPLLYNTLRVLLESGGRIPLLAYALLVLVLTAVWVRASGGAAPARSPSHLSK